MAERDPSNSKEKGPVEGPVSPLVQKLRGLNPKRVAEKTQTEPGHVKDPTAVGVVAGFCGLAVGLVLGITLSSGGGSDGEKLAEANRADSDEPPKEIIYQGKHGIEIGDCAFGGRVVVRNSPVPRSSGDVALDIRGVTREVCWQEATEAVVDMNTGPREKYWDLNYERGETFVRPARLLPENYVIR